MLSFGGGDGAVVRGAEGSSSLQPFHQITKLVPVTHRATARTDWEFARRTFTNFSHLAGKPAAVLADGNVVKELTFSALGVLTLPDPAAVVHFGIFAIKMTKPHHQKLWQ